MITGAVDAQLQALHVKATLCPALSGKGIEIGLWTRRHTGAGRSSGGYGPQDVLSADAADR